MKHDQPRDPPEDLSKRVHALSDGELQAAIKGPKRTTNPLFAKTAQAELTRRMIERAHASPRRVTML